jgi:hypothetical protein
VPLVTLFFSYLFCVCVLMGILTRSPLASLLVTILFWLGVFSVHTSEAALLVFKASAEEQVENQQKIVKRFEELIARNNEIAPDSATANSGYITQLENAKQELPKVQKTADQLRWWHTLLWRVKAPLPKTAETVDLMSRWLVEEEPLMAAQRESYERQETRRAERRAERERAAAAAGKGPPVPPDPSTQPTKADFDPEDAEVMQRVGNEMSARTAAYIIGTSLGFEAVILGLAAWIFVRRDF